jgi:DNA (cytosine-5)-methyltransferase 3A
MRILTDIRKANPDVLFLLENVMMGDKWESVLSQAIGVKPIEINSSLVSAQNRRRLYWTNIGLKPQGLFGYLYAGIEQPKDKGVLLRDILENEVDEKYFLTNSQIDKIKKWNAQQNPLDGIETNYRKNGCLTARGNDDMHSGMKLVKIESSSPNLQDNLPNGSQMINTERLRRLTPIECERLQTVKDNYTNHVSDSQRYKMLGNGWTIDVIAHILSYINK